MGRNERDEMNGDEMIGNLQKDFLDCIRDKILLILSNLDSENISNVNGFSSKFLNLS